MVAVGVAEGWCIITYSVAQIPPLPTTAKASTMRIRVRPARRRMCAGGGQLGATGTERRDFFPGATDRGACAIALSSVVAIALSSVVKEVVGKGTAVAGSADGT